MEIPELITRNIEEILTEEELIELLRSKKKIRTYVGYETSGFCRVGLLWNTIISRKKCRVCVLAILRRQVQAGLSSVQRGLVLKADVQVFQAAGHCAQVQMQHCGHPVKSSYRDRCGQP